MSSKRNGNNKSTDISKRRSIRIVARDDYSDDGFKSSGRVLQWMLRLQGRFDGEGDSFPIADAFKQYQHVTQTGYGYSYDPEFFEGFIFSRELYEEAKKEMQDYNRQRRAKAAKEEEEYWNRVKLEQSKSNRRQPPVPQRPIGILRGLLDMILKMK